MCHTLVENPGQRRRDRRSRWKRSPGIVTPRRWLSARGRNALRHVWQGCGRSRGEDGTVSRRTPHAHVSRKGSAPHKIPRIRGTDDTLCSRPGRERTQRWVGYNGKIRIMLVSRCRGRRRRDSGSSGSQGSLVAPASDRKGRFRGNHTVRKGRRNVLASDRVLREGYGRGVERGCRRDGGGRGVERRCRGDGDGRYRCTRSAHLTSATGGRMATNMSSNKRR